MNLKSVKLEPGKTYAIWFKSNKVFDFQDVDKPEPAVPGWRLGVDELFG